mmetsp:Transcript_766/g.2382  ORF Transcript_766/g.2382 Transcript_766/m.2382 type:complete len:243 (+) Transcript_766:96-824(+)
MTAPYVYRTLPAKTVTIAASSLAVFTILITYIIGVLFFNLPVWLPMISDGFAAGLITLAISRLGIIVSAFLLWVNNGLMFFYIRGSMQMAGGMVAAISTHAAFWVCTVACFCLAVVAAVDENENGTVHGTAAVIFFVGELVMMFVYANRLNADPMKNSASVHFKHALAMVSVVVGLAAAYFASNWHRFHIQVAECEWFGVFLVLLYNLSFLVEFKDLLIGEILEEDDVVYRQNFQTYQKVRV